METTPVSPRATSRWGRSRLGGGSALLLALSLAGGLIVASGLGALLALFGEHGSSWLGFVVGAVITLPAAAALCWALLVDWSTIAGGVERPQESIESVWYGRAATGTFHDILTILGLGAAAFSITRLSIDTGMLFVVLGGLAMADFGLRYWVIARAAR
ncbi:MAG: hypothetical protein QM611_10850 [Microbacterium sp.]|uniref:hypothetical protein n=1 Tax=Microbacterium sp. TaxID=51671 RepID=UPI0039E526B2